MRQPSGLDYATHADLFRMYISQESHRSSGAMRVVAELLKVEEVSSFF